MLYSRLILQALFVCCCTVWSYNRMLLGMCILKRKGKLFGLEENRFAKNYLTCKVERQTERKLSILHLLVYSPNCLNW